MFKSVKPINLIYVVDSKDMLVSEELMDFTPSEECYSPNFTIPGMGGSISSVNVESIVSKPGVSKAKIAASVAAMLVAPPVWLLVAAVSARPMISQLIGRSDAVDNEAAEAAKVREMEEFLRKHAITASMAEKRGYRFPPGHPLVGHSYKLHPLSELPGSGRSGVYIPQETYDEILLAEREAELLRLLVELGATKIIIHEREAKKTQSNISGEVGTQSKVAGELEVGGGVSSKFNYVGDGMREFELVGKPWCSNFRVDRSRFAWLAFEPSWDALVSAREIGECTKATVEIKEETSFSSEKRISLMVKSKIYGGAVSGEYSSGNQVGRTCMVRVEFAPFKMVNTNSTAGIID